MNYKPKFPKPGPRKKKSPPKVVEKEAQIQAAVEQYLMVRDVPFIRLPDSLMRAVFLSTTIQPHIKAQISSYLKGIPDIIILKPNGRYCKALPMELKTTRGKLLQDQKAWQKRINTIVVRSFRDARAEIDEFLSVMG